MNDTHASLCVKLEPFFKAAGFDLPGHSIRLQAKSRADVRALPTSSGAWNFTAVDARRQPADATPPALPAADDDDEVIDDEATTPPPLASSPPGDNDKAGGEVPPPLGPPQPPKTPPQTRARPPAP